MNIKNGFIICLALLMGCKENMEEKIIKSKEGVLICTESFGDKDDPAVLLLAGATVSMLYWDEKFCKRLAEKGLFVIRYDNRDVGKSTNYPEGVPPYDIMDLEHDAISILNAYGLKSAHFAGMSLGGLISQIAALTDPERVASLTLISTGPWGPADPNIPEMDKRIIDFQSKADKIDWSNEEAVTDYMVQSAKLMSGNKPFNEGAAEKFFRAEFKRAQNYRSMFNHAVIGGGEQFYDRLEQIHQRTLIIHGTEDKIWHFLNAKSLEKGIKQSRLVKLEGTGHELHQQDWALITSEIANHIKNAAL